MSKTLIKVTENHLIISLAKSENIYFFSILNKAMF
jgi:hypothetical protein